MQASSSALAPREKRDADQRGWAAQAARPVWSYGAVVGIAIVAFAGRSSLAQVFGDGAPLLPFIPAILIGAWLGGLGPGLLATLLGTLAGAHFFLGPEFAPSNLQPHQAARLVLFVTAGAIISVLMEQMHRARRRAETSEARLAAILSQLPVGVGLLDRHGRFVLTNRIMESQALSRIPSRDPDVVARWKAYDENGRPLDPSMWPASTGS